VIHISPFGAIIQKTERLKMNPKQRKTLRVCTAIVVAMLIFPPFIVHLPNGASSYAGFGFIFWPPDGGYTVKPIVHLTQLIAQWAVVIASGASIWRIQAE
jgi:hypothetical protein